MIYILSLNPCMDKTLSLPKMDLDNPNRVLLERTDVGGKGVNVARVIRTLDGNGLLMGFDYAGSPVEKAMEKEGVSCALLPVDGDMRVNLKIRETDRERTVEINEKYKVPTKLKRFVNYPSISTGVDVSPTTLTWVGIGLVGIAGLIIALNSVIGGKKHPKRRRK